MGSLRARTGKSVRRALIPIIKGTAETVTISSRLKDALNARKINMFFGTTYTADDLAQLEDAFVEELLITAEMLTKRKNG